MKKSLFAVAAATAFAGAAQAQSSVTVYGIFDVGFTGSSVVNPTSNTVKPVTVSSGFSGAGQQQTSRIGFRGMEDLGGGMSAFFTIEANLLPESAQGSLTINRQTFAGLAQKGIGSVSIGQQYTPIFNLAATTNPGQYNGTIGDLIYVSNNAFDNATAVTPPSSSTVANALNSNSIGSAGYTNSVSSSLFARSDRMSGFQLQAMYGRNAKTANATVTDNQIWGLGLDYQFQKLTVNTAYQSLMFDGTNSSSLTAGTSSGVSGTNSSTGVLPTSNVRDNQFYAGATYDFGVLRAYLQYSNRQVIAMQNVNSQWKRTAQQVGVRGNVTKTVEGWASVGNGKVSTFPTASAASQDINISGFQVGSNYWLSKRTNLYAIYGAMNANESATFITGSGAQGKQYALGLRHTF